MWSRSGVATSRPRAKVGLLPEQRLDKVVVRGGVKRTFEQLEPDIVDADDQGYGPVLSVFASEPTDGESLIQTVARICVDADIPNGKVQVATFNAIRAAGFRIEGYVENGWPASHCHVFFDLPVPESQIRAFVGLFGEPIPNPAGGKKAKS